MPEEEKKVAREDAQEHTSQDIPEDALDDALEDESAVTEILSISSIFKRSWRMYGRNMFSFVSIGLLPALLSLMLSSSFPSLHLGNPVVPFYYALLLAYIIAWLLHWPAWFSLARYRRGIKDALQKGTERFWEFWITAFVFIAVIVGASLFFIVPGILLAVITSFALHAAMFERVSGVKALLRSRELFSGLFWQILGRYIALITLFGLTLFGPLGIIALAFQWDDITWSVVTLVALQTCFLPLIIIAGTYTFRWSRLIERPLPQSSLAERSLVVVFSIIGIPFIAATIYVYGSNAFWLDEAPYNDQDLRMLSMNNMPEAENAFFDLQKAHKILHIESGSLSTLQSHAQGQLWDQSFVDDVLSQNEIALAFFKTASEKDMFQIPTYTNPDDPHRSSELDFSATFGVVNLAAVDARNEARKGNGSAAFEEAFRIVYIGYRIEQSRASDVEHAFGGAVREAGLSLVRDLTNTVFLPPQKLRAYAQELSAYADTSLGLYVTLNEEYLITKKALDDFSPTIVSEAGKQSSPFALFSEIRTDFNNLSSFHYKPNKTHRLLAQSFRNAMDRVREECGTSHFESNTEYDFDTFFIHPLLTENSVGKKFLSRSVLGSSIEKHLASCNLELSTAATQTILAIRAYYNTYQSYPETLETLAEYSFDPYSSIKTQLQYDRELSCIHSIGKDHADTGGSFDEPWKTAPDPTFCFSFE